MYDVKINKYPVEQWTSTIRFSKCNFLEKIFLEGILELCIKNIVLNFQRHSYFIDAIVTRRAKLVIFSYFSDFWDFEHFSK